MEGGLERGARVSRDREEENENKLEDSEKRKREKKFTEGNV